MTRQLILVTEAGIADSEDVVRFEVWAGDGFTEEEWWREKVDGSEWTMEDAREETGFDLIDVLQFYSGPGIGSEYWLFVPEARLRGVAYCTGIPEKDEAEKAAWSVLHGAEYARAIPAGYLKELCHVFLGTFSSEYPRNVTGDGCWAIQFQGLKACAPCSLEGTSLCLGAEMLETGRNSLGLEIPIKPFAIEPRQS